MQALIIDESKKPDWDRFVNDSPHVISWHCYNWSQVLKGYYSLAFYPLAVYDSAKICGILPLYQVRTLRTGQVLISIPYAVAGGIVAEDESAQQLLLRKAIELAQQTNSARVVLRQYRLKIQGELITDGGYYNRELTLSENIDDVWNSISETNRETIRETEKYDLALEYPSSDVERFCELLLTNQHARGVPCVSKPWVEWLLATQMYKIALLKLKGAVVAGTLAKKFKATVSFPLTCLPDQQGKSVLFAYQLYWRLITRFASDGIRIFHSGRILRDDSAPTYRLGWGGTRYDYYYQYYEKQPSKMTDSSGRGKKRKIFESAWKKIPRNLARIIGPAIVKQFP